jgi:hypothetical protein
MLPAPGEPDETVSQTGRRCLPPTPLGTLAAVLLPSRDSHNVFLWRRVTHVSTPSVWREQADRYFDHYITCVPNPAFAARRWRTGQERKLPRRKNTGRAKAGSRNRIRISVRAQQKFEWLVCEALRCRHAHYSTRAGTAFRLFPEVMRTAVGHPKVAEATKNSCYLRSLYQAARMWVARHRTRAAPQRRQWVVSADAAGADRAIGRTEKRLPQPPLNS